LRRGSDQHVADYLELDGHAVAGQIEPEHLEKLSAIDPVRRESIFMDEFASQKGHR